ncbi:hypothetical protein [Gorillibacterium timonense]|nr:hypothetical protein [Gorillibacterium timonense]
MKLQKKRISQMSSFNLLLMAVGDAKNQGAKQKTSLSSLVSPQMSSYVVS